MFAKKGALCFSLAFHALVITAAAMWKLSEPPPPALETEIQGGGRAAGDSDGLAQAAPMRVFLRPKTVPVKPSPEDFKKTMPRLTALGRADLVLPPPVPQAAAAPKPQLVVLVPPAPSPSKTVANAGKNKSAAEAQAQHGKGGTAKSSKSAAGNGNGAGVGSGEGKGSSPVAYLERAPLDYPSAAQQRSQEGAVVVKVYVNSAGRAETVQVVRSSGYDLLDAAAVRCAKRSRYAPAKSAGTAVSAWVEASFRFKK